VNRCTTAGNHQSGKDGTGGDETPTGGVKLKSRKGTQHFQSGLPRQESEGAEEMSRKETLSGMRQLLLKRRDALRKALAGDLSMLKELREHNSDDVLDAALATAQDELSSQLAEVESRELAQIENALERMREGQYGLCEGCNEPIPLARLQALPYATECIRCRREAEKSGRGAIASGRMQFDDSADTDSESTVNDEVDVS
jgi:DnaK suppressor protein